MSVGSLRASKMNGVIAILCTLLALAGCSKGLDAKTAKCVLENLQSGEPYDSEKARDSAEASARALCQEKDPSKLSY
jgi:hypothetical protein